MATCVVTIGDGAMATVCAGIVAGKVDEVRVWGRDNGRLEEMDKARENRRYLPGMKLPGNVRFLGDDRTLFGGEVVLIVCAVPTQFMRAALRRLKGFVPKAGAGGDAAGVPVVSVAKGIEIGTLKRPSEIIGEELGDRTIAALSGPSIAGELARGLPATMVVATGGRAGEEEFAKWVQELFTTRYLRVYRNEDLVGVELAGALKNVIAVAAGMLDGMKAGNNAKAALLTRGLVEITRLGVALGGRAETFAGLAGLGDLVTTCVSPEGRNRSFGERVGRGEKAAEVQAAMVGVVEGVSTCRAVVSLAREKGIDMPICEGLHGVLFEGKEMKGALAELMARELKSE